MRTLNINYKIQVPDDIGTPCSVNYKVQAWNEETQSWEDQHAMGTVSLEPIPYEEYRKTLSPYDQGYGDAGGDMDPHDKWYNNPYEKGTAEYEQYDEGYEQGDWDNLD